MPVVQGCLPSWVNLPSSAALPFGAFEAVLQHEQNAAVAQLLHDLCKDVSPSEQLLLEARQAVQSLESPPEVQEQLRESLQTSGKQRCTP